MNRMYRGWVALWLMSPVLDINRDKDEQVSKPRRSGLEVSLGVYFLECRWSLSVLK